MRFTQVFLKDKLQFKYWKRWVEREMHGDQVRLDYHPLRGWREIKKTNWYYGEHRPWTYEFKQENDMQRHTKYYVEPLKRFPVYKGDKVEIQVGKDKGKVGLINCIIKERNWCYVDGLNNEYVMHSVGKGQMPLCRRKEKPLLVTTQVKLVDPTDDEACDIVWRVNEEGEEMRVSTRTGRIIPLPYGADIYEDGVLPQAYKDDKTKDTSEKLLKEVTFVPKIQVFEDEIMELMDIKEDRKPAPTFWY